VHIPHVRTECTQATSGLIAPSLDDEWVWSSWWNEIGRRNWSTWSRHAVVPPHPP
jgi:hypothetical protein